MNIIKKFIFPWLVFALLIPSFAFGWGEVTRPQLGGTSTGYGVDMVGNGVKAVATLVDLKAINVDKIKPKTVCLFDRGGGVFVWDSSNLSAEVAADTQGGIYIAPDSDSSGASGAWVMKSGVISVDAVALVPGGFSTLQGAIDNLASIKTANGAKIEIKIESSHSPASGIVLSNGDFSRFEVVAVDSVVTLSPAFSGAIVEGYNAKLPVINAKFDCNGLSVTGSNGLSAVEVTNGSKIIFKEGSGVINNGSLSASNVIAYKDSNIIAYKSEFTGSAFRNVWVTHQSRSYFDQCIVSDSGGNNVFVSRASVFTAIGGDYNNSTTENFLVYRSRAVLVPYGVTDMLISGGTVGISATSNSQIVAHSRTGDIVFSGSGVGIQIDNASTCDSIGAKFSAISGDAIRVSGAASVYAGSALFTGIGGSCVRAVGGSMVNVDNMTALNHTGDEALESASGSVVSAEGATITGATKTPIYAIQGGKIIATSAAVDNCLTHSIYALWGEVNAINATGTGSGGNGVYADQGSFVNVSGGDFSGSTTYGAFSTEGGRITGIGSNFQVGGSTSVDDIVISRGGMVFVYGATGGTSQTPNAMNSSGVIFK